jgi:hypothetical protein
LTVVFLNINVLSGIKTCTIQRLRLYHYSGASSYLPLYKDNP